RFALIVCAGFGLLLCTSESRAGWGSLGYSGYQPWYNIFAHRNKCMTPEEERLQKFWHDYYDALGHYYKALDHIDWVAYYKNHGYQINGGCGGGVRFGGRATGPSRRKSRTDNADERRRHESDLDLSGNSPGTGGGRRPRGRLPARPAAGAGRLRPRVLRHQRVRGPVRPQLLPAPRLPAVERRGLRPQGVRPRPVPRPR